MEKNRVHYEYYHLGMTENVPEDYTEIFFVCLREDGCLELPATIETACRTAGRKVPELEGFHFHTLRHTYTTNLLSNGAQPKGCAGTVRTLRREYHHECLCPCYKGSKADFRKNS